MAPHEGLTAATTDPPDAAPAPRAACTPATAASRWCYDVDLHVVAGEVVTLLGHNGSGKTTTIKTVLGLFPAQGGRVLYDGHDVTQAGFRANVKAGMALIPSERFVFPDLTVIDNLLLGGANEKDAGHAARSGSSGSTSCSRS